MTYWTKKNGQDHFLKTNIWPEKPEKSWKKACFWGFLGCFRTLLAKNPFFLLFF